MYRSFVISPRDDLDGPVSFAVAIFENEDSPDVREVLAGPFASESSAMLYAVAHLNRNGDAPRSSGDSVNCADAIMAAILMEDAGRNVQQRTMDDYLYVFTDQLEKAAAMVDSDETEWSRD